jgi:hypothetical protein
VAIISSITFFTIYSIWMLFTISWDTDSCFIFFISTFIWFFATSSYTLSGKTKIIFFITFFFRKNYITFRSHTNVGNTSFCALWTFWIRSAIFSFAMDNCTVVIFTKNPNYEWWSEYIITFRSFTNITSVISTNRTWFW